MNKGRHQLLLVFLLEQKELSFGDDNKDEMDNKCIHAKPKVVKAKKFSLYVKLFCGFPGLNLLYF